MQEDVIAYIKEQLERIKELLEYRYLDGYEAGRLEGQRDAYHRVLDELGIEYDE